MPLNVHGFMKAFKAFKGTAKKCENKNVSQFLLKYNFEMHGGEGLTSSLACSLSYWIFWS